MNIIGTNSKLDGELTTFNITLTSVEDVKKFIRLTNTCTGDITVGSDRYVVDGKSIMGIFTLDFTKSLTVNCIHSDAQIIKDNFSSKIA